MPPASSHQSRPSSLDAEPNALPFGRESGRYISAAVIPPCSSCSFLGTPFLSSSYGAGPRSVITRLAVRADPGPVVQRSVFTALFHFTNFAERSIAMSQKRGQEPILFGTAVDGLLARLFSVVVAPRKEPLTDCGYPQRSIDAGTVRRARLPG